MINKLDRERTAQQVINRLCILWGNVNGIVTRLQNTNITVTTTQLIAERDRWVTIYTLLNDFNNTHGTWFATEWPDYATALTGAITSLQNINNIINTGLQNNYWDPDTDKPIISEISQVHRNALAASISDELE